jgi:hypothetical protein
LRRQAKPRTFVAPRHLYPDFCHAIRIGRAARVAALETKLLTTSQGVGVTAAIFALKNADPDEWQDRYNTETKVAVSIEKVPDAELLAIIARGNPPALIEAKPTETAKTDGPLRVASHQGTLPPHRRGKNF